MAEEIRGVTWDLDGAQLAPWQAAQRLYKAGFEDAKILTLMWATLEGESGRYLKAWHHNVDRDESGQILYFADGKMLIKSTDLGFIQRNVVHAPQTYKHPDEAGEFTESLFQQHADLARGDRSAEVAWELFKTRAFQPWYAYTNGHYRKHMPRAALAVANFLAVEFGLGRDLYRIREPLV
jgi:hypothetical protein